MELRGRALLALVLAAVLGVASGVVVALVAPGAGSGEGRDDPSAINDPLHLGVPLVDLECTGESIMVVGYGDSRAPLDAAVADNPEGEVRYLRTDDSCPTQYGPPESEVPSYVAYLGPFDTLAEPCAQRMTDEHKGDNVTRLNAGNVIYVKCACVLDTASFPVLRLGQSVTAANGIWVRALQGMLVDTFEARGHPERFGEEDITGVYDERTAALIEEIQAAASVHVGPVNQVTWRILRKRACATYSY